MNLNDLVPLGLGFARVNSECNACVYFYKGKRIPDDVKPSIADLDNPTDADVFTCELAGM